MKKIGKISGIVLAILVLAVLIIPVAFEGKILELVKKTANNNLNAIVNYEDASLSIWRGFPNAQVSFTGATVVNTGKFEGDTLVRAKSITLQLPLMQLFKSSSAIAITKFDIDQATLNIKVDRDGNANYDIAKKTAPTDNATTTDPLQLKLEGYSINNTSIAYEDLSQKLSFLLSDLNHSGSGDLSSETSTLQTTSTADISLVMDSVAYLNKNKLQLDALIGIDLTQNKYSFLENKALINQLPLVFDGFIQVNENNQDIDLSFTTPSSDFKNFLAVIPEVYAKNIADVKTTGDFSVKGMVKGISDETHIPTFDIVIKADNASFKYPDLPKTLEKINLNTKIVNTTGIANDTYVDIDTLSFQLDQEVFHATAKMTDLTENMKVEASLNGGLNLAHLSQIHPAEAFKNLAGNLKIDAQTKFDLQSIEQKKYENTFIQGQFDLQNFAFESEELTDKLFIDRAGLRFNNKTVSLQEFAAKLGQTDFKATGSIHNLLGFLFNKEDIEGAFSLDADVFAVNDFMVAKPMSAKDSATATTAKATRSEIKIPSFLNCTIKAKANTVLYDNITLKNVAGTLIVKDEQATLKEVRSNIFGGDLGLNGTVSTQHETPTFKMALDIKSFNINTSFEQLDLLKALAPIASAVDGKLNSTINLAGNLNSDFTPNLTTLNGSAAAELLTATINQNGPILTKLKENLNFLDLDKLDLDEVKTVLTFADGKVQVNPFTLKYKDIDIDIAGGHGFDNTLGYTAVFEVPVKYLGKEGAAFLAKLDQSGDQDMRIPITANIGGKFASPVVNTDLKAAVSDLGNQLIDQQKEELKDKVEDKLIDLLGGKKSPADTTKVDSTKNVDQDKKKEVAKDLLKGLLGKKKKDTVVKKDTVK